LSFGVELGLEEISEDGFEDGIKLRTRSTLGVKLGIGDSPEVRFDDGS
jgi:hypothetical protein